MVTIMEIVSRGPASFTLAHGRRTTDHESHAHHTPRLSPLSALYGDAGGEPMFDLTQSAAESKRTEQLTVKPARAFEREVEEKEEEARSQAEEVFVSEKCS